MIRAAASLWRMGRYDVAELERRTLDYYDRGTAFDDQQYLQKGLQGWEIDALLKHFPAEGRLLLAAAGGGRETRALEAMGYQVASFDPSDRLVESYRAISDGGKKIIRSSPASVPEFTGEFDGAIIGWGGYTHIPEKARRVAFLHGLTGQLKRDAPLMLSFFLRYEASWRARTSACFSNTIRRLGGKAPSVEPGDSMTDRFQHRFLREEVMGELMAGGLTPAEFLAAPFPHAIARVS